MRISELQLLGKYSIRRAQNRPFFGMLLHGVDVSKRLPKYSLDSRTVHKTAACVHGIVVLALLNRFELTAEAEFQLSYHNIAS